jgi:tripartite ATP-independent transporter DctM subunit
VTWPISLSLLLGAMALLMATGMPVALTFLGVNIVGALLFLGGEPGLMQLSRNALASITSFSLTPIPFFVLMGEILFHTGVALRSIEAIELVIRRVPGRLAVVAVVAGTVFSAISGSTIATTALLGSLLLPEMLRRRYEPRMAMGPIMAIGGVDMLIPPSALTVLLGSLAGISISKLLIAGIVPGAMLSVAFVAYIVLRASRDPALAPSDDVAEVSGWPRWRPMFVYVVPLASIFAVVIGAMTAGWATPTEAAALGSVATVAFAAAYRALTWRGLLQALLGTAAISAGILFIIVGATTFAQILSFSGAVNGLVGLVTQQGLSPWVVVLAMMALLLVLGCFVDQVSMMLLTLPFYMPLVKLLGIDPIWFGVLFLICMQLGLLTPPFGLLLITMKSVAPPQTSMGQVYEAAMPYVWLGIAMLIAVMLWPPLATWLPGLID